MSEYADGFDDGKGEKFDELMVEIVNLRLDFQNCEAKRVGAINSLREHINICNWLKIENAALREQLAASKQEVEVQKAKAEKHYELGTEYFDLMVKAEREIAGLQKLLKRSATYIVPLSGQRDRIFLNQIDAALNKIDAVITATGEEQ
jgi:regulator of replication initiation timing